MEKEESEEGDDHTLVVLDVGELFGF